MNLLHKITLSTAIQLGCWISGYFQGGWDGALKGLFLGTALGVLLHFAIFLVERRKQ